MIWTLSKNKTWAALEKEFDWIADMNGVQQDPVHHAEGDVAIHTRMVIEALRSHPGFQKLNPQVREVLWASALLHDVEKRSTTVIESGGSITSRGHAKRGEFTTREILFRDIPTPFSLREQICALVRLHGLPLWVFEKQRPEKALLDASLRVNTKLLATLARADVRGRICGDQQELLDRVSLFEDFCQEQNCWGTPRSFASDLARFVFFHKENSSPDYDPFDDTKCEVIMLSGLPGMGKDTYIRKFCSGLQTISLDDIRRKHKLKPNDSSATGWAVQEAREQAKAHLRRAEPFVWNATNITRQMRSQWIDLFASYKARVRIVYVEVAYKDWIRQNSNREDPVPGPVLEKLLGKLEVPTLDEAHQVEYFV
jgi:predicted kinase